jgi:hypothetical protein
MFLFLFSIFYTNAIIVDARLDLNINPIKTYGTYFYTWTSGLALGSSYSQMSSYIFPFGFLYYFFSLFTNINVTQAIVFSVILFIGFYSFTKFVQNYFKTDSNYVYLGAGFYIFNMYVATTISASYTQLLLPYVVLPLQLYFINKIVVSRNYFKYSIGLAAATLLMGGIDPPFIAINLIVMSVFFLSLLFTHNLLSNYKETLKKLAPSFLVVLLINFFWVIGILSYWFGGSADFQAALSESLSMQNQAGSYFNVFRMLGLWAFGLGWAGKPYFSYAATYLENPLLIFTMYLWPIISLSSVIFFKKSKQIFWVLILIVLSIPMVVATNQGIFANLYNWAYYNVPLFSMFRSSYRFIQVYIFGLAILTVYLMINIKNIKLKNVNIKFVKFKKVHVKFENVLAIFLLSLLIINAFPFFTRTLISEDRKIQEIPSYYYDAQHFFEKDQSTYRIFLLPEQYGAVFTWGTTSGNPELIWNKGLVVRLPLTDLEKSNNITLKLYTYIFDKNYSEANKLFKELNVKYIVQRNDFDWRFYSSSSPATVQEALSAYEKIETFGALDIYKVPDNQTGALFESTDNIYFEKISPVEYKLYLKGINDTQNLSFLESFDKNWKLYLEADPNNLWCKPLEYYNSNQTVEGVPSNVFFEGEELSYLWKTPIFDETHQSVYNYANNWKIDSEYVKANYPKAYYIENPDGTIDVEMTLFFNPQSYFFTGLIISGFAFVGCAVYLFYDYRVKLISTFKLLRSFLIQYSGAS